MKRKTRPWLLGGLVIIVILLLVGLHYTLSFPIDEEKSNLVSAIEDRYSLGRQSQYTPTISIYDSVTIGKKTYVLIEIDEDLGQAILIQNPFGRYKLGSLGYGSANFREGVVQEGEEKYFLFGGRNTGSQIAEVSFSLDGIDYQLDIPQKERFLVYTEIDPETEAEHWDLGSVMFYNAAGEDITDLYDSSSAGI